MRQLHYSSPLFGCDPEFFFQRSGQVIGSEKVIPTEGLSAGNVSRAFVQDGIQVELNPRAEMCRAYVANQLRASFIRLREHLGKLEGVSACFSSVVEVSKEEMDTLNDNARVLGCQPSKNHYDKNASISVNTATYMKRSAGGHIHLGLSNELMPYRERIVPILDILLGNTCVMIDRDPGAAERRQVYGRAGEYRLPSHGLEYRTLSNFWLRAYPLTSFVFGMSRMAVSVLSTTVKNRTPKYIFDPVGWDAESELLSLVDLKAVAEAINTNDIELAKKNYEGVRKFISEHVFGFPAWSLDGACLGTFDKFLKQVEEKGIESWFPTDPIEHWCNIKEGHSGGWEDFLMYQVK